VAFETGHDVVAGMVELESGILLRSHVVKVPSHSTDVNYLIRSARGCGGAHCCATTTRNLGAGGFFSSVQSNSNSPVAPKITVCVRKRVLRQSCSRVFSSVGVKTVRVGKLDGMTVCMWNR